MSPRLLARSWPHLLLEVPSFSSLLKAVYNPKAFFPHAASLHQAFAHCARFPTAASRRSLDRVSVPVWLSLKPATRRCLGEPLPHQLADRSRDPPKAINLSSFSHATERGHPVLAQVSLSYSRLRGRFLTCYSPVRHSPIWTEVRVRSTCMC